VLLTSLYSTVPAYFIKHSLGERDLGIFTAIGFMISVGNMAVVSLGQSAFTRLARSFAAGNLAEYSSLLAKLLAFWVTLACAEWLFPNWQDARFLPYCSGPNTPSEQNFFPGSWRPGVSCLWPSFWDSG